MCVCVCISFYAYLLHMPGILLSCSVYACAQVCVDVCVCVYVHTFKHLLSKGDLGRGGVNSSMCVVLFDTYLVYMHWILLSCTVLFKGASLTTGAFCLSVATFSLASNLWKGKKKIFFFFFLKKKGILVADCDLLQAVMPVISVILYILHLYMKVIQVCWFDQYFLPIISLSAF